jgi:hypothetical protein
LRNRRLVPAGGAGRATRPGVHPPLEIRPALLGNGDLSLGELSGVLAQDVEQNEQVLRVAIENAVELRPVVATQLAQWSPDLAGMRKRQWRRRDRPVVEPVDLEVERRLLALVETIDELVDGVPTRPARDSRPLGS